jgi:hypothetical protein
MQSLRTDILQWDKVELHHADGNHGNWNKSNLQMLHRHCHQHQPIHGKARVARNHNDVKVEIDARAVCGESRTYSFEWEVSRGNTGIDPNQCQFKSYYLYGAVAPQTGESFWLEFSDLDGLCFQVFLEQLASEYPEHLNIVQLDNGRFHYSSSLKIPDNILLIFQPPYSPELNPIERVWHYIKQELS